MLRILSLLSLLFVTLFVVSFIYLEDTLDLNLDQSTLEKLIQRKKWIEDMRSSNGTTLERLVGLPGDSNLIIIKNGRFPPGYDRIFNVVRDKKGNVLFTLESPVGRTDDWLITHSMYYDDAGKVFAYVRETNFSNSKCIDGVAFEKKTYYYDSEFKVLKYVYELTDFYKKPLKKELCVFPYNFDYKVISSYKEFAKEKKIKSGA